MLFAGTRFALAGLLVIVFGCITQKKFIFPRPRNIWKICLVALFQTALQYTFFYIGLAHTSGVKSSVLNGLGVFFTIICACFIFRTEKFNLVKLAGCILGFGAVILINLGGDFTFKFTLLGEGFVIFSGLFGGGFRRACKSIFKKRKHYGIMRLSVFAGRNRSCHNRALLRRNLSPRVGRQHFYADIPFVPLGLRFHLAGIFTEIQSCFENCRIQKHQPVIRSRIFCNNFRRKGSAVIVFYSDCDSACMYGDIYYK